MRNVDKLITAIIKQAADDYIRLKNSGEDFFVGEKKEKVKLKDVLSFFTSTWCTQLLYTYGCEITGSDLLRKIEKERNSGLLGVSG